MVKINKNGSRGKYNCAKTGKYKPINPQKYEGSQLPVYKSSLEHRFMIYLDRNPDVLKWSYENLWIWYLDKSQYPPKKRKYFIDFTAIVKCGGFLKKIWVEVKDQRETVLKESASQKEKITYIKNQCKWSQARQSARMNGAEFKIITDKELK